MGTDDDYGLMYRRGRSGRPLTRLKTWLKANGDNVCWRCGKAIDMALSKADHNHAMAWTLDHVVPLSIDPSLALEPSNAREAHRKCNSARGNSTSRITMRATRIW